MPARPARPDVEAVVYGALCDAAIAGAATPTCRELRALAGCRPVAVSTAIEAMEKAGKILRHGETNARWYFIPALGRGTKPPNARRPSKFNLTRDPKLTAIQRNTLSLARLAILRDGCARVTDLAREMGVNEGTMSGRLTRIARYGHLRQREDMTYELATPAQQAAIAAPQPRVEFRDGLKVTICPPMPAPGALVFRSGLGIGGVALASGGQQRIARRA